MVDTSNQSDPESWPLIYTSHVFLSLSQCHVCELPWNQIAYLPLESMEFFQLNPHVSCLNHPSLVNFVTSKNVTTILKHPQKYHVFLTSPLNIMKILDELP